MVQQAPSITLNSAQFDFGSLDPVDAGVNRFLGTTINVAWNATIGSAWTIEVSTDNIPNFHGLLDNSGQHVIELKWNRNDTGGNPNNQLDWQGDDTAVPPADPKFFWVFDSDDTGGFAAKIATSGNDPDIANLDFKFACEVDNDQFPGAYRAVVDFDLIFPVFLP